MAHTDGVVIFDPQTGRVLKRLTKGIHRHLLWSPDGRKIVYGSGFENHLELHVVTPDGKHHRRITHNHRLDEWPAWAPGSKRLVLDRSDAFGSHFNTHLIIAKTNGTRERRLTDNHTVDMCADWSPDGSWIAFDRYPGSNILMVKPDGSHLHHLTSGSPSDVAPQWSPDSRRVLFRRSIHDPASDTNTQYLITARRNGTGLTRLFQGPGGRGLEGYGWSPDGRKIVFVERTGGAGGSDLASSWVMRSDGSHVRKLADEGDVDDASPSWSRNGKKIVYVVDPGSGYDQIWIARVDGSGTRKLALHRKGGVVDPDWYRSSQQCGGGY